MTSPLALAIYHAATRAAEPAGALLLRWRERQGKEDPERWRERLGQPGRPRPPGLLAWLHGASVGESLAILPLATELVHRGLAVLVTTGTVTSSRVLADRLPAGALHQFVPLDLPGAAARFMSHWRPDLAVFAESELWPNLLCETSRHRIPTVLVNARMSARSFARWSRFGGPIRHLLGGFALVLAQSEADAERFRRLGATTTLTTGSIKFDGPAPPSDPEAVQRLKTLIGDRPVWLAASTHVGEDELCCDLHRRLAPSHPGLLTILVPRKTDRGPAIADHARRLGLPVAVRSQGGQPDDTTAVYVADTMGELGLFFRASPIAFMGKSLVAPGGGQNPIEAAKLGAAVLHGPHVANFRDVFGLLDGARGSLPIATVAELEAVLSDLLRRPDKVDAMAQAAAAVVSAQAGSTMRVLAALDPILAAMARTGGR